MVRSSVACCCGGRLVGQGNVGERHVDVLDFLAAMRNALALALMLMEKRDRADRSEVLHVVAPRARAAVEERQITSGGVRDQERPQQTLCVVTWGYDDTTVGRYSVGRLSSMTDPAGSTSYSYDRRGLLRHEERTTPTQETFNTRFRHSADGERTAVTYPSGTVLTYAHDYAGRPISAATPGRTLVTSAAYLPFGPATRIVYGNGTEQAMQYDGRYQMLENKLTTTSGTIAEYDYASDGGGNVTAIADAVDARYSRTFAYDDLNRLTTANTGTALWRTGSYSYDAMGNMLSSKLGDGESVARQEAHFSYAGTTAKVATVRNNDIVDTGENLARRRLSGLQANSDGYHTVTYDAAGNELSYVATRTYSARNLLESVREPVETGSAQHRVQYEYDGRGIRLTRKESWGATVTGTTRYVYSPELQLLASTGNTGAIRHEFLWFGGRPLAQVSTDFTGPRWYFTDHLGTPILQTDQNAATAWRVEYEPYGDIYRTRAPEGTEQNPNATPDQPLRFPGQEAAMNWEGTEERYNIHRWYRSGWGRYTQADPIGLDGGVNLFAYAAANPQRYSDRLGLDTAGCDSYMWNLETKCELECVHSTTNASMTTTVAAVHGQAPSRNVAATRNPPARAAIPPRVAVSASALRSRTQRGRQGRRNIIAVRSTSSSRFLVTSRTSRPPRKLAKRIIRRTARSH
jgi:RHS repeat-associated protein